ncbi:transposase [Photorhabdus thracensis]
MNHQHRDVRTKNKDRWLREYNMFLCYLPAYSPELNLIEIVWKQAKYRW